MLNMPTTTKTIQVKMLVMSDNEKLLQHDDKKKRSAPVSLELKMF